MKVPSGFNTFDLCQEEKCVEGGKFSTFGGVSLSGEDYSGSIDVDKKNYFINEEDVTDVVKKQNWVLEKPLKAKMTDSVLKNLPEPVVIVKEKGEGGKMSKGKVILSPKKKRAEYGNLLDEYEKVEEKP